MNIWQKILDSADRMPIWQRFLVVLVVFLVCTTGVYYWFGPNQALRSTAIMLITFTIGLLIRRFHLL